MPITDEVRESNSPWIKASERLPTDVGEYFVIENPAEDKTKQWRAATTFNGKIFWEAEFQKEFDLATAIWLDEEKLSRMVAELETFKDAYVERNDECNRLKAELEVLKAENERLKQWKKEAMPMMEDFQAIAKALGIPLGQSIHDKILPGIEAKDKRIAELETKLAEQFLRK